MKEEKGKLLDDIANKAKSAILANFEAIKPFLVQQEKMRQQIADLITPILRDAGQFQELFSQPTLRNFIIPENNVFHLSNDDRKEIAKLMVGGLNDGKRKVVTARTLYQLPKNSSWENLRIKFFDGHTVKVKYPGLPLKTFDYKDMGFKNNKTQNPNRCWIFLRVISERGGTLSSADRFDGRFNRQTKFETSERLKAFFALKTDPFSHYSKKEGFRPKFALIGERDVIPLGGY